MRLSKDTINGFQEAFASKFTVQQLIDNALLYKQNGYSFVRYFCNLRNTIKTAEQNEIIKLTAGVKMVGGCLTNVTGDNIDTAVKKALLQYTGLNEKVYNNMK